MSLPAIKALPEKSTYDVIVIGGAIMGSSVAWHLSNNPDFTGAILVVEKDSSYEYSSTARTNSCMRQQFSNEINIRMSQYTAEFIRNISDTSDDESKTIKIDLQEFGYMYLANTTAYANILRGNQKRQAACGAGTRIMSPDEISDAYPFYNLDDIILGSHNLIDEGYFDGNTLFEWWRRNALKNSVEYISNEAVSISATNNRVDSILLKTGDRVFCGTVVNATGTHAAQTARMAGLHIPVEPRLRYSFLFSAEKPLDRTLPLTIDPSGVHVRSSGAEYLCGCAPEIDLAVEFDNFQVDHKIWDDRIWPALAARIPTFEAIKVVNSWAGHYAFNTFDQNAIVGPHSEVENFMFLNGFSGHGLQQSPAMGRAINEFITYGEYRTLDLSTLGYDRVARNDPFIERAII